MRHLIVWGVATVAILGFTLASQAKSLPAVKNTAVSSPKPTVKNEDEWAIRSDFDVEGRYRFNAERICHNNVIYLMVVGPATVAITPELSVSGRPNTCQSSPRE